MPSWKRPPRRRKRRRAVDAVRAAGRDLRARTRPGVPGRARRRGGGRPDPARRRPPPLGARRVQPRGLPAVRGLGRGPHDRVRPAWQPLRPGHRRARLAPRRPPGADLPGAGRRRGRAGRPARRLGQAGRRPEPMRSEEEPIPDSTLVIEDLHVNVADKQILRGVDLTVESGRVHALMGPNGSGKSTLAYALAGHPRYQVTGGKVTFKGEDVLAMTPDERARVGVFRAMEDPGEVPGVSVTTFLRTAMNSVRGEDVPVRQFAKDLREQMRL